MASGDTSATTTPETTTHDAAVTAPKDVADTTTQDTTVTATTPTRTVVETETVEAPPTTVVQTETVTASPTTTTDTTDTTGNPTAAAVTAVAAAGAVSPDDESPETSSLPGWAWGLIGAGAAALVIWAVAAFLRWRKRGGTGPPATSAD